MLRPGEVLIRHTKVNIGRTQKGRLLLARKFRPRQGMDVWELVGKVLRQVLFIFFIMLKAAIVLCILVLCFGADAKKRVMPW